MGPADTAPDRARGRLAVAGKLVVKLRAGNEPRRLPHYLSVATGLAPAPIHIDGGALDRTVRRFSPALRVTRAFESAWAYGRPQERRAGVWAGGERWGGGERWDSLEHEVGLSRTLRVEVDPATPLRDLSAALRELAEVESVTPLYLGVTPFADPVVQRPADRLYAHRMVRASEALRFEAGDETLIVAVVDSGVALDHREFSGRLRQGFDTVDLPDEPAEGVILVGDAHDRDRDPHDQMGHGTACASIIGARGYAVPPGLAGQAKLLPARALAAARLSARGRLTAIGSLADIDQAVKLAVDLGARVLNLSFGTPESALRDDDPQPHGDIVDYALRRGCVLIAASGNSGSATRYYPAAHPGVIAVGSVDERRRPSRFCSRGAHVALCAPGEHVPGAALDGYQTHTGTSFAAPFVAATSALLLARAARYGAPLHVQALRRLLTTTAREFAADADAEGCGAGVLDAAAAVQRLDDELRQPDPNAHRSPPKRGPQTRDPDLRRTTP